MTESYAPCPDASSLKPVDVRKTFKTVSLGQKPIMATSDESHRRFADSGNSNAQLQITGLKLHRFVQHSSSESTEVTEMSILSSQELHTGAAGPLLIEVEYKAQKFHGYLIPMKSTNDDRSQMNIEARSRQIAGDKTDDSEFVALKLVTNL